MHQRLRPDGRQHLRLFKHRLRRLLLLVGRVSVLAQNAFNRPSEVGANILSNCPVDHNIAPHRHDQLSSDSRRVSSPST